MKRPSAKEPARAAIVGERFRYVRHALGLLQPDIYPLAKVSASECSLIEHERKDIYTSRLVSLCRALDVSADFLLGLADRSDRPTLSVWVTLSGEFAHQIRRKK